MIKLLPTETQVAKWNGITVTTSRVIVQGGNGNDDFSLTQFPVEDYRGIEAKYVRPKTKQIFAILVGMFAFVAAYLAISAETSYPLQTPQTYSVYDVDKGLVSLEHQLGELKTKQFVWFRETQVANLQKQITDRTQKARKWIEDYNRTIAEGNSGARAKMAVARTFRFSLLVVAFLGFGLSGLLYLLFLKTGTTVVEIAFNNRANPVTRTAHDGKRGLSEAIEFVTLVEEHLNPFTGKLAPKSHRRSA